MTREEAMIIAAILALFGALIGALAALVGQWITGSRQVQLEAQKIELEKEKLRFSESANVTSEARQCIQESFAIMASAIHSMCWVCWLARVDQKRVTEDRFEEYNAEMHKNIPIAISTQARVVTYNGDLGRRFSKILSKIEDLDAKIGAAVIRFLNGDEASIAKMIEYHKDADNLHDELEALAKSADMENVIAAIE